MAGVHGYALIPITFVLYRGRVLVSTLTMMVSFSNPSGRRKTSSVDLHLGLPAEETVFMLRKANENVGMRGRIVSSFTGRENVV